MTIDKNVKLPAWYWERGLHDAVVLSITRGDLPVEYDPMIPIASAWKYCSTVRERV